MTTSPESDPITQTPLESLHRRKRQEKTTRKFVEVAFRNYITDWGPEHHRDDYKAPETPIPEGPIYSE